MEKIDFVAWEIAGSKLAPTTTTVRARIAWVGGITIHAVCLIPIWWVPDKSKRHLQLPHAWFPHSFPKMMDLVSRWSLSEISLATNSNRPAGVDKQTTNQSSYPKTKENVNFLNSCQRYSFGIGFIFLTLFQPGFFTTYSNRGGGHLPPPYVFLTKKRFWTFGLFF